MERLNNDEFIAVAEKVANFGTHHLRDLLFTSKDLARICKIPTIGLYPQITWIVSTEMMSPSIMPTFSR